MVWMIFEILGGNILEKQKAIILATISHVTSRTVCKQRS